MVIQFTKKGEYHSERNEDNQDAMCFDSNRRFAVISLADGVSSCREAKTGAEIASRTITSLYVEKGNYFFEYDEKKTADLTVSHVLYVLKKKATEEKHDLNDYSSTMACVLFDKTTGKILSFNLGDSIIIGISCERCIILAPPFNSYDRGCCVTTTSHAQFMSKVKVMESGEMRSVLICSDGAWEEMFYRGHMKSEIKEMLIGNSTEELKKFFLHKECFDDCSFILMSLCQGDRST